MEFDNSEILKQLQDGTSVKIIQRAHSVFQADLYHVAGEDAEYVIKDFSCRPWLIRKLILRWCASHEYRVMERLGNLEGVPSVYSMPSREMLVMEFIPNKGTLPARRKVNDDVLPVKFFFKFRELVDNMHAAGVAHGDIRRRNVLITDKGPVLIDFATAVYVDGYLAFVRNAIYRLLRRTDLRKAVQFQHEYYPHTLTSEEIAVLNRHLPLLWLGRWVRRNIYRKFLKKRTWRKRIDRVKKTVSSWMNDHPKAEL